MRSGRLLVVVVLALSSLGAATPRSCAPVGDGSEQACVRRNWITAGATRVSGGTLVVFAGDHRTHVTGPSWSPRRPGATGGGAWSSSGAEDLARPWPTGRDGVSMARIVGGHRGVIDSVSVVLFARSPTWPTTQHLRVRLVIDGVEVLARDGIAVTPQAPVAHTVQRLSLVVTDLHAVVARHGLRNGSRTRHVVEVAVGPSGPGNHHTYLWGSVEAPSEVSFNLPPAEWPAGTTRLAAR